MKNKHFTFDERVFIQECLDQAISIHRIAKQLKKADSSISREIQRNRYRISEPNRKVFTCMHYNNCNLLHGCGDTECNHFCRHCFRICNQQVCPEYEPLNCEIITHSPFVCNGCKPEKMKLCRFPKYRYNAKRAQVKYEDTLKSSRQGISVTEEEMMYIDNLVSPLLFNGHSIKSIFLTHKDEIPCSERTLYNYVNQCYLTARNIDMPRKVKYKVRYKHGAPGRNHEPFTVGRTYSDFNRYIHDNPDLSIVEMDTVIGTPGGKVLLTLLFRNCSLMLAFLLPNKTQECVCEVLNELSNAIGIDTFQKLFGVILTDRGTEFSNPYAVESDRYGEIKTRVFYCDSYCSWQKGMIEKKHEFIRYVLPSGKSFDNYTQEDITLLMNHINNYPRANLNGNTPFILAKLLLDEKLLKAVHFHKIRPDDVILKPFLLRKTK